MNLLLGNGSGTGKKNGICRRKWQSRRQHEHSEKPEGSEI
jgi:hypothetical protein